MPRMETPGRPVTLPARRRKPEARMRIINRTMTGLMALSTALATYGMKSPEVAALGGLSHTRTWWRRSMGGPGGTAAQHKRAAKKLRNMRARSAK